jgi:hypothetical protein
MLRLVGLDAAAGRALLADKKLAGDAADWDGLVGRYSGNALALQVVGATVAALFGGEIAAFLAEGEPVFGGIRRLLGAQLARLSPSERAVLYWLAVEREPVRFADLAADLGPNVTRREALEALEGLGRHSFLEPGEQRAAFTLQPVVLEHVTEELVAAAAAEVRRGRPALLVRQPGAPDRRPPARQPGKRRPKLLRRWTAAGLAGGLAGPPSGGAGVRAGQRGQPAATAARGPERP